MKVLVAQFEEGPYRSDGQLMGRVYDGALLAHSGDKAYIRKALDEAPDDMQFELIETRERESCYKGEGTDA